MKQLTLAHLERARAHRWRTAPARQIQTEREALRFIRELGFVLLVPIQGGEVPSMDRATLGSWGTWWDWKQTLPQRRACYYAHLLRARGTFLAWDWFAPFYAAYSEMKTYHQLFREGRLDRTAKAILDVLSARGPLLTRELRLAYAPPSKENTRRLKQALVDLQRRFLICAAGGDTEGWSQHRWDLVERWVAPECLLAARSLSPTEARAKLLSQHLRNTFATTEADLAWLFSWPRPDVHAIVTRLLEIGEAEWAEAPELGGPVLVPGK